MGSVSYKALTPLSFLERSARVWPGKVEDPADLDTLHPVLTDET